MRRRRAITVWLAALGLVGILGLAHGPAGEPAVALKDVSEFDSIKDPVERSKALFVEAGRVIQHPRCLNCHPSDAHPRQGEDLSFHEPPVVRGEDNHGSAAMRCDTCHQDSNVDHAGVPGHPKWHLAPIETAWIGKSLGSICMQLKDPSRNGGMDLEELHEHMAEDTLVGWGWNPGAGREPAPGTQVTFGKLIRAWIDTGAHCPDGESGAAAVSAPAGAGECASCH